MVKKRVDPRVKGLIEYGVRKNHRSMFVLVGDHGKDQVENLHKILSRCRVKARPSVLWCYKKELGFSTHRQKRIKEIKRNQARGLHDPDRDDPFDLFISSTNIRWTYYKESEKILGQTFGMCVLQDFEALTPNLLARTIETVEGGGLVILLLKTVKSLKQLYAMTMDVHSRFRTEAHHEIVPRFNERFILSLGACAGCLVLDDELNILPISSQVAHLPSSGEALLGTEGDGEDWDASAVDVAGVIENPALRELKLSLADTPNIGSLVSLAKTLDQANAVMSFLDAISEKSTKGTVALTAARGRGKSAAIGLCLAGAISYGYANIFVTAPSPENLKTVFEFVLSGLKVLKYVEHMDFEVISEHNAEIGKVVVRINVFREHRQCIQYILPGDDAKLSQAELVAIDEAAAIPLPTVKKLMNAGSYLSFLSSTVNGYEGTGRALSLKLVSQLRTQQSADTAAAAKSAGHAVAGPRSNKGERHIHEDRWKAAAQAAAGGSSGLSSVRKLTELTLEEPIRYGSGDPIEKWLNSLLCLDSGSSAANRMLHVMPPPRDCELYMVNRDALFSFHSLSEAMLQRIWALYTAAHYKNSPNDLQMLSDAPAHRLFVLLGPKRTNSKDQLPDVLCVVQVAFEGFISQQSIQSELQRGNKASGDMIPWTLAQQFNDNKFASLSGARVVRIATHPDVQKMGYGSRAIDLLCTYFQGELSFGAGPSPAIGSFGGEGAPHDEIHASDDVDERADESTGLLGEALQPRKKLPPLLTTLADRPSEKLHWLGVSFGLTSQLLNFWSRKGFKACYLRQTPNELTGEHSSILLKELSNVDGPEGMFVGNTLESIAPGWLEHFVADYRRRLVSLMSYSFSKLDTALAITLVDPERVLTSSASETVDAQEEMAVPAAPSISAEGDRLMPKLTAQELLTVHLTQHDLKRLELYSRNMVDHHMILDTLPILSRLLFLQRIDGVRLSFLQIAILLATGLQHRDVDSVAAELDIPVSQVLAFFNKTVRKIASRLSQIVEQEVAKSLPSSKVVSAMEKKVKGMDRLNESLSRDQKEDEKEFKAKQQNLLLSASKKPKGGVDEGVSGSSAVLKSKDVVKHAVSGDRSASIDMVLAAASVSTDGSRLTVKRKTLEHDEPAIPSTVSIAVPKAEVTFPSSSTDGKSAKKKKDKKRNREQTDEAVVTDTNEDNGLVEKKKSKKHKKME